MKLENEVFITQLKNLKKICGPRRLSKRELDFYKFLLRRSYSDPGQIINTTIDILSISVSREKRDIIDWLDNLDDRGLFEQFIACESQVIIKLKDLDIVTGSPNPTIKYILQQIVANESRKIGNIFN